MILAAKIAFVLFVIVASGLFLVWIAAVVIFSIVETRQERHKRRRGYRVGEVWRL